MKAQKSSIDISDGKGNLKGLVGIVHEFSGKGCRTWTPEHILHIEYTRIIKRDQFNLRGRNENQIQLAPFYCPISLSVKSWL